MPTRSRSRSLEREARPVVQRHARSRDKSSSPRRERHQDRSRRNEGKDRRDKRSRSRDRGQHQRRGRSRSRSPRRRRNSHSRSRSRSRSKDRREKRKRRHSHSVSLSDSDSDDERKRRRKGKKSKRKESRERRKERKKDKKDKGKVKSSSSHWGKYGIITEVDLFTKGSEFQAWLVEERKVNPETLSKDLERKEFARFIEDYNTATLPHEKFYDMATYERRMDALRQGEFLPPADDTYDPEADMRALTGAHKKKASEKDSYMSREQLEELRKVQNERVQVSKMKLLGMDIKQTMGVRMDGTTFDEM